MSYDLTDGNNYFLDSLYEENVTTNNAEVELNNLMIDFDATSEHSCDDSQIKNTIDNIVDNLINEQMDEQIKGSDEESDDSIAPSPEYDVIASAVGLELCQSMCESMIKSPTRDVGSQTQLINMSIDDTNSNDTYVTVQECTETVVDVANIDDDDNDVIMSTKATKTSRLFGQRKRKRNKKRANKSFAVTPKASKKVKLNDASVPSKPIVDCSLFGNIDASGDRDNHYDREYALQCKNWFKRETRIQTKSHFI